MKKLTVTLDITLSDEMPSHIPYTKSELEELFVQMAKQETSGLEEAKATIIDAEGIEFKEE